MPLTSGYAGKAASGPRQPSSRPAVPIHGRLKTALPGSGALTAQPPQFLPDRPCLPARSTGTNRTNADSSTQLTPSLRVGLDSHYPCGMADPSDYEFRAWRGIQRFKGRPLSRVMGNASGQVAIGAAEFGKRATKYLENYPRTQLAVSHGQGVVAKGTHSVGSGARKAVDTLPEGTTGWSGAALESMRRTVGRVSRAGLSSKRVVARHQKRGHDVASLSDLRRLDLEQIDASVDEERAGTTRPSRHSRERVRGL